MWKWVLHWWTSCAPNWTGQTCDRLLGECGGVREEEKGSIAYPGGNSKYPSNAKCSWTILAPVGFTIQLSFSKFDLEPKTGQRCHDDVTIYDNVVSGSQVGFPGIQSSRNIRTTGNPEKPTQLGTFCGSEIPPNQRSMSNSLEINFHSDGAREATGFVADWTMVEGLCGGRLNSTSGIISTPGYPSPGISGPSELLILEVGR